MNKDRDINIYDLIMKINTNLKDEKLNQIVQISSNVDFSIDDLKVEKFLDATNYVAPINVDSDNGTKIDDILKSECFKHNCTIL